MFVGEPAGASDEEYLDDGYLAIPPNFRAYLGGIPGVSRGHPEARLVDAYVRWMQRPDHFSHRYLPSEGLFTDLFDRAYWRLLEAKADCERRTLRTAVGQLYDYKRYFARRPSLGVLLPERPSNACMNYLRDCRVVVVWRTPAGRFSDSTEDKRWTKRPSTTVQGKK